jgi:Na+-transporting NADH:ubiquinone oxidoreductase subunit C
MPQRDSLGYTFGVAAVLCVFCSLAVSAAAVALRPAQEVNRLLDRQKNILDAAGLAMGEIGLPASQLTREQIDKLYARIEERLVDLETGQFTTELDIATYDPRDAAKQTAMSVPVGDSPYTIGKTRRERLARVFLVRNPKTGAISQVVLPVYGAGLWSTLYGYLALKRDLSTVQGLTFYEHAETPGLGGEVDNPGWKAQWVGVQLFDESGQPAAGLAKGPAPANDPHLVDGLSGATITSNGVTNLIRYWVSEDGYGPFLRTLRSEIDNPASGGK